MPGPTLTDTDGQPYDLATDTDKPLTLVFFGYTNCPDVCPVVMANLASALVRLDPADRDRSQVVFVTTDPARDTGRCCGTTSTATTRPSSGLTGPLPAIVAVGQGLRRPHREGPASSRRGGYDVAHGTQVVGARRPDGTAPFVWTPGDHRPAQLAARHHQLILDDKVPAT